MAHLKVSLLLSLKWVMFLLKKPLFQVKSLQMVFTIENTKRFCLFEVLKTSVEVDQSMRIMLIRI